jgi:LysR family hydrogen peroxide-inducible transcriptional activator
MKAGHCLGDQVLGFCERQEVRPRISFRSAQFETVQELVCAGLGLSLVPAMARRTHPRPRARLPLAAGPVTRPQDRARLAPPAPARPGRRGAGEAVHRRISPRPPLL